MHQKVEIESIALHPQASEDAILASVRGQIIRTGVLEGKQLFNEVWAVRAELMWTPNPNLRLSGRYPMACSAFSCRETPVASTIRRTSAADAKSQDVPSTGPATESPPPAAEGAPN
jgi:hypothetical protein